MNPGHYWKVLLDSVPDCAVFLLSKDARIESWSAGAEKIFGYTSVEAVGAGYQTLEGPDSSVPAELQMASAHGRFADIVRRRRKNGDVFPAEIVLCPLRGMDGSLEGFTCVTRDLSEVQRMKTSLAETRQALEQARKMEAIGKLAAGVAHDFNNLVVGILGLSQDVYEQLPAGDPLRTDLAEIIKTAQRAGLLSRHLLAYGRPAQGDFETMDANAALSELEPLLRRKSGGRLTVTFSISPLQGPIAMDRVQWEQVVLNIFNNACDATPPGGRIDASTEIVRLPSAQLAWSTNGAGDYLHLRIRDSGIGIAAENMPFIFEPFYSTKPKDKGSGLGLSTVYALVKQCQGDLHVESTPGAGTCFDVLIPLRAAAVHPPSRRDGERILIVDDERLVREAIKRELQKRGFRAATAPGCGEALHALRETPGFDLLLTDVLMPEMNGWELSRRALEIQPGLKCLFMSSYAASTLPVREVLESGVPFVEKSLSAESLARRVRDLLNTARD